MNERCIGQNGSVTIVVRILASTQLQRVVCGGRAYWKLSFTCESKMFIIYEFRTNTIKSLKVFNDGGFMAQWGRLSWRRSEIHFICRLLDDSMSQWNECDLGFQRSSLRDKYELFDFEYDSYHCLRDSFLLSCLRVNMRIVDLYIFSSCRYNLRWFGSFFAKACQHFRKINKTVKMQIVHMSR